MQWHPPLFQIAEQSVLLGPVRQLLRSSPLRGFPTYTLALLLNMRFTSDHSYHYHYHCHYHYHRSLRHSLELDFPGWSFTRAFNCFRLTLL